MDKFEFLNKIGVELPSPQIHPQFGTELPNVYLDRCLDIIIPAVEKSWEEAISIDTVISHLLKLKKKPEKNEEEVKSLFDEENISTEEEVKKPDETGFCLYDRALGKKIIDYFASHPKASRVECAAELGVTFDVANRICSLLIKEGKMSKTLTKANARPLGDINVIKQWFIDHPDKTREECAAALGISFTNLRNINIKKILEEAKKEGKVIAPVTEAKVVEVVAEEPVKKEEPKPVEKTDIVDVKPAKAKTEEGVPATYMQDLKARYENRDKKSDEPHLSTFPGFLLQSYFNSLSREEKEKAITEFWTVTTVSPTECKEIVSKFTALGFTFIKSKLTRMQYNMLKKALETEDWKDKKVKDKYYDYIR